MNEIWKTIEGTNNHYEVSNFGNIRCDGKLVKTEVEQTGYVKVRIRLIFGTRWFSLHRVVAAYFCENPENKDQVNHIDGNKENNAASNLEWVTNTENQRHRIDVLKKDNKGKNNPMYGMSGEKSPAFKGYIYQIDPKTNEVIGKYAGSGEAAKAVLTQPCSILKVINKPNRTCKGYKWTRDERI